jgi:phosphate transport system substrate-binding protein
MKCHAGVVKALRAHTSLLAPPPRSAGGVPNTLLSKEAFMTMKTVLRTALVAAFATSASVAVRAADISGAGATFPYPIYAKWADAYKKETGNGLNYQSIGSGGGIKQIKAKTVTFGATDAPLKPDELQKDGLAQWPMVMGGIVPVVNIDGVKPGDLALDGATLAKIFMGEIKSWDDAAIKALNPNAKLPSSAIAVVHRSDGSGTTFNFTNYLSKVSPKWKSDVGENTAVEWPVGIGAKGNEGVANNVANTKGSVGYVEYAYAKQNKLTYTNMNNHDGKVVSPTSPSFQAAAANADWANAPGFYQILTDEPGAESWPITAATFILMPKQPPDPAAAKEALKFFDWAFTKGGKMAEELDYIPMPEKVVALIRKEWSSDIKDTSGKPLM